MVAFMKTNAVHGNNNVAALARGTTLGRDEL